eukprot:366130-Chlamydomonas_euryale.AAC.30
MQHTKLPCVCACVECPHRPDLAHRPGHMGLARLADACSNKRWAMGRDNVSRRLSWRQFSELGCLHDAVLSKFGEGRAGAILIFPPVGVKIAARTCATEAGGWQ